MLCFVGTPGEDPPKGCRAATILLLGLACLACHHLRTLTSCCLAPPTNGGRYGLLAVDLDLAEKDDGLRACQGRH